MAAVITRMRHKQAHSSVGRNGLREMWLLCSRLVSEGMEGKLEKKGKAF